MRIKKIYRQLQKFVMAATGLEDAKVIPLNMISAARPKKPYITIDASAFKNTATPINKVLSANGQLKTTISMVFNASFQAFSDVDFEAQELLSDLYARFSTELPDQIFKGKMAKRRTLKHVTSIPMILNQQIEGRAILEVEMGYLKSVFEQVGVIEAVAIERLA